MRHTIKAVARRAGVSVAIVSRALNDAGKVSSETLERILAIAHKMKFTPSAAARGLITSRTEAIGLLLPDVQGEFYAEIIRGADREAQKHKYHLVVSSSHNNKSEIESALRLMRGRVDGIVIMSPQVDADLLESTIPTGFPVVLLNCRIQHSRHDTIVSDGCGGAREITGHLIDSGHRHIAVIKGKEENLDASERLKGFRAAFEERRMPYDPQFEIQGDFSEHSGYEAAKKLLSMKRQPTAVFAANDSMAIGAMGAFHEAGIRVPQHISVCGFDDLPIAKFIRPSLTSVHVPIHDLGSMAVHRVIQRLSKRVPKQPSHVLVPTTLSIRSSTKQLFPRKRKSK